MERKTGWIWLMFSADGGIIREDGSPVNYTVAASDIAGFKSEEWRSYDCARCTFVAESKHATLVDVERSPEWMAVLNGETIGRLEGAGQS